MRIYTTHFNYTSHKSTYDRTILFVYLTNTAHQRKSWWRIQFKATVDTVNAKTLCRPFCGSTQPAGVCWNMFIFCCVWWYVHDFMCHLNVYIQDRSTWKCCHRSIARDCVKAKHMQYCLVIRRPKCNVNVLRKYFISFKIIKLRQSRLK